MSYRGCGLFQLLGTPGTSHTPRLKPWWDWDEMKRKLVVPAAMVAALVIGAPTLAACGSPTPKGATAAQKSTCRHLGGTLTGTVEKDGDVKCDFPTERSNCTLRWEEPIGNSHGQRTICRVELTKKGDIDTD